MIRRLRRLAQINEEQGKNCFYGLLGGLIEAGERKRVLVQNPLRTSGSCIICEICVICGQKIIIRRLRRLTQINEEQEKNWFLVFLASERKAVSREGLRSRVLVQIRLRISGSCINGLCIICVIRVICGQKNIIRGLRRLARIKEEQEKNWFYGLLGGLSASGREEKVSGFSSKSLAYKRFVYNL